MTRRQTHLIADIFTGIVAISVGIALAGLTWRLVALASHRPPQLDVVGPVLPQHFALDVTPIIALAPFGNSGDGPLQPTTQPLLLRGVVFTVAQAASSALIAANGGAVLPYKVGQSLPGGATVDSIAVDRVILGVAGHRELLTFPLPNATPGSPPTGAPASGEGPSPPGTSAPASTSATTATNASSTSQSLLDSLGATAVEGGYRVGDTATVRQTGLLPGDLVTQVNGTLLGNPATDRQVLSAAARSGTVRIDVVRKGQRMTITVSLN